MVSINAGLKLENENKSRYIFNTIFVLHSSQENVKVALDVNFFDFFTFFQNWRYILYPSLCNTLSHRYGKFQEYPFTFGTQSTSL